MESILDRLLTGADIDDVARASRLVEHVRKDSCGVVARDRSAERVGVDADAPGPRLVGQAAGSENRPRSASGSQRRHGNRADPQHPAHSDEVSHAGAAPILCDLEQASVEQIASAVDGVNAVVFAAGAGQRS